MVPVIPTNQNEIWGRGNCSNSCRNNLISKYLFKGKMKDSPISLLAITKTRHWATQYKKSIDTFPVLCADKNFQGIDDVIWNGIDLVATDFTPIYPNSNLWWNTYNENYICWPNKSTSSRWLTYSHHQVGATNTRF